MSNKGICNLAVIPLRKLPDSTSEIVSQLLFGDVFTIHSINDGWAEIVTDYDHYAGYISQKQYAPYQGEIREWQVATAYPFTELTGKAGSLLLPPGCSIPAAKQFTLAGESYETVTAARPLTADHLLSVAKQYLNAPYLWGGKTPFGIDCSGFTQMVFKQCGIDLPRDAYQQAEAGHVVAFVGETRPGDLAFFDNEASRITHVGMMMENQQIIHASGRVRIDDLDHYGIMNLDEKQYSHKLRIIKRLL